MVQTFLPIYIDCTLIQNTLFNSDPEIISPCFTNRIEHFDVILFYLNQTSLNKTRLLKTRTQWCSQLSKLAVAVSVLAFWLFVKITEPILLEAHICPYSEISPWLIATYLTMVFE